MIKFRKPKSPAFNQGEVWYDSVGYEVEIVSVYKHKGAKGNSYHDYSVVYKPRKDSESNTTYEKDCWSFQCRYNHSEIKFVKKPK